MEVGVCGDCGVFEGGYHEEGCDLELCGICGGQRISCRCPNSLQGLERVRHVLWPNLCARCGHLWPEMFLVSDDEWKRYIQIAAREQMVCKPCYELIKALIDANEASERLEVDNPAYSG